MTTYKKFIIECLPFHSDLISGLLWELDINGINEEDGKLIVFCNSSADIFHEGISQQLVKLKTNNIIERFNISETSIEERNWNEEWEKSLNVIKVSEKFVIKPSHKNYTPNANEIIIQIDPKMSFGTGEHETTKLSIQLLEKHLDRGCRVLDVGSGTGILSIAAAKLGAYAVTAIDNDPWCYDNGMENIKANDCQNIVKVKLGEIDIIEDGLFDLIIANINKNILKTIALKLSEKLTSDSTLILSGLLVEDEPEIIAIYNQYNFNKIDFLTLGEWIAIVFKH